MARSGTLSRNLSVRQMKLNRDFKYVERLHRSPLLFLLRRAANTVVRGIKEAPPVVIPDMDRVAADLIHDGRAKGLLAIIVSNGLLPD